MTHKSVGVFPGQRAIRSVSQNDLRRLTYGTSYRTGVPGKVSREEDKWENFIDLHGVGRRDTRYMKFQKMTAPLLDRSACTARRDFVELPLGDNIINAELANNFKSNVNAGKGGVDVSAKHLSTYAAEHGCFSPSQTKSAKSKSTKPKSCRTSTITGMTDLLETRASSHVAHSAPDVSLAKAAEIVLAKPNLNLAGSWPGEPSKSMYHHDFCQMQRSASSPQLQGEDKRHPALLPDDHPSFGMRRMCYMSPGM